MEKQVTTLQVCLKCKGGFKPEELWDYEKKLDGYLEVGKMCETCFFDKQRVSENLMTNR